MESYDPYTDSWTPISPALKYVSNFSAAGCRGRLYLVGSSACKYNALALQCYNPVTGGRGSGTEDRGPQAPLTGDSPLAVMARMGAPEDRRGPGWRELVAAASHKEEGTQRKAGAQGVGDPLRHLCRVPAQRRAAHLSCSGLRAAVGWGWG